jgi:hypothetical protein
MSSKISIAKVRCGEVVIVVLLVMLLALKVWLVIGCNVESVDRLLGVGELWRFKSSRVL